MGKKAFIVSENIAGLREIALQLSESYSFAIAVTESVRKSLGELPCAMEVFELSDLAGLIGSESYGSCLILGGLPDVDELGAKFMSWQKTLDSIEFEPVAALRCAAHSPMNVTVAYSESSLKRLFAKLRASNGLISQGIAVSQATETLHALGDFDAALANYLEANGSDRPDVVALSGFPRRIRLGWERSQTLVQGENKQQKAALYGTFSDHFEQLAGEPLDFETMANLSMAAYLIGEFQHPTVALVQKANLLGAALASSLGEALKKMNADCLRLFHGGVLVANATLDESLAARILEFDEPSVIAPNVTAEAQRLFSNARNSRLFVSKEGIGYDSLLEVKSIVGGALIQDKNCLSINPMEWQIRSAAQPLVGQWEDMIMATKLSRHLRSASCVAVKGESMLSQSSGAVSQELALRQLASMLSKEVSGGFVLAFDERILRAGIIELAKELGATVVLHPGSDEYSDDQDLIESSSKHGIVLVATGRSHTKL